MTTPNILPTEWHRRPNKHGPCELCGCWYLSGHHRLVDTEDNKPYRWVVHFKDSLGKDKYRYLNDPPPKRKHGPKPGSVQRPHVPSKRIAVLMGKAATLVAQGKTVTETAEALGVRYDHICDWQKRWRETWQLLVNKAAESLAESVRAMAGTDKILDDPDKYMAMAQFVDRWATKKGVELFPIADGVLTLSRFYQEWYVPNRLGDAREKTKLAYNTSVQHWRLLAGDPPVKEITTATISRFRDCLLKMRGKMRHLPMSPNSVRSYMRHLQTLLDKLGPPGQGNRDALDILTRVPWAKPPHGVDRIPKTITLQQISDCIMASVAMEVPRIPGVKAPAWWRALLTVVWNTGLRIGTLLSMHMDEIDWQQNRLVLAAARMKSRRPMIVHLNSWAMAALRSIRTDRELVFPWNPKDRRSLYRHFHTLQDAAGIPKNDQFGFHTIRKTVATMLYEVNPGAAQFALGHTTNDVTRRHYVDGGGLVARALDQLPQPEAFPTRFEPPEDNAAA